MAALPILQGVNSDLEVNSPQLMIDIDRDRAAALGVTTDVIRSTLYGAFGTNQISTIYKPTNSYEVIMESIQPQAVSENVLSHIYVHSTSGTLVPLDSVATHPPPGRSAQRPAPGAAPRRHHRFRSRARRFPGRRHDRDPQA